MDLYRQRIDELNSLGEARETGPHTGVPFSDPEGNAYEVYVTGPDEDDNYDLTCWRRGDHDSGIWASGTKAELLGFMKKAYAATKRELEKRD